MGTLDYVVIVVYLAVLIVAGIILARRAGTDTDHYFLGGRKLPWWTLGASGMSSNLDVAGTMTILTMIYLYGLHGFFIEMRGGVVLPIAVFLAFMGKWHQRSRVMTTAEWMQLRFGDGLQGKAARLVAALTYLVITVGMVVFFLAAAGKFFSALLPFTATQCAVTAAAVALFYTTTSGLYGVVWTDVFQAVLIGMAAVYVALLACTEFSPDLSAHWPGADLNTLIPHWQSARLGSYEMFGLLLLAWVGKGLLEGLGGSGGSAYMAQRFYAAGSEKDCMKIGMLWTVLFSLRWPMVLGFAILAASLGLGRDDPERILPEVLASEYFPDGIRGLLVAAMLAAAMSTFDSTINAGASYAVKDIYGPLRGGASERELVWIGYAASVGIVALGLAMALTLVQSIVDVWVLIVIKLFPAFLVPFSMRWYWSRFNGAGFTLGVVLGFFAAIGLPWLEDGREWSEAVQLGVIAAMSLAGCLVGTFASRPVDAEVLRNFYQRIRPAGWWPTEWKTADRSEHRSDLGRLAVALIWQVLTFLLPMSLMLRMWTGSLAIGVVWLPLTLLLVRDVRNAAER